MVEKGRGRIDAIETKTAKNGVEYSIYKIGGNTYGVWAEFHKDFSVGDDIVFEYEIKGNYKNILEADIAEEQGQKQVAEFKNGDDRTTDIRFQVALKCASNILSANAMLTKKVVQPIDIVQFAKEIVKEAWK